MNKKQNSGNQKDESTELAILVGVGMGMYAYIYTQNMSIVMAVFVISAVIGGKIISKFLEVVSILFIGYIIYRMIIL